jgi:hypothetical protein
MAQQYLVENCLNTGGAGVIQGLTTSLININNDAGGGVISSKLDIIRGIDDVGKETGNIDFLSIPNASRGKIRIVDNTLIFQSGDNEEIGNGKVVIPELTVRNATNTNTLFSPITKIVGNSTANVYNGFSIRTGPPEFFGQGESYELISNKLIFTYKYEVENPNFIEFTSDLFVLGMVFLKDETGINDLPGVTLELDYPAPPPAPARPPILRINNIPSNPEGYCNGMLLVI